MSMEKRNSPADICLQGVGTWLSVPKEQAIDFDGSYTFQLRIEIRARVCPWCEQSTEYILANNQVIKGIGMSSLLYNGKQSDCCERDECKQRQRKWHEQ